MRPFIWEFLSQDCKLALIIIMIIFKSTPGHLYPASPPSARACPSETPSSIFKWVHCENILTSIDNIVNQQTCFNVHLNCQPFRESGWKHRQDRLPVKIFCLGDWRDDHRGDHRGDQWSQMSTKFHLDLLPWSIGSSGRPHTFENALLSAEEVMRKTSHDWGGQAAEARRRLLLFFIFWVLHKPARSGEYDMLNIPPV